MGRVQLERIDELIERKRQIFGWYADRLAGAPLRLNFERPDERTTYWMVTPVFDAETGITADQVRDALAEASIPSRPFFPPLSSLPAFEGADDAERAGRRNPVSDDLARRAINLPSSLTMWESDVDRVCAVLDRLIER